MTLLFKKTNFCDNFITFLEVSKLLITNYFLTITFRQGTDHKKVLQLNQRAVYLFAIKLKLLQRVCDEVAVLALSRSNT